MTAEMYDPRHPHEPAIPPALDAEGRCLVCSLLVDLTAAIQEQERLRSELRKALYRINDARDLITPGMRAGTAEARALLDRATAEVERSVSPASSEQQQRDGQA